MARFKPLSFITRNIWLLSVVSFFTDVASEMLYPIMPLFLEASGFSVAGIGLLEGFAEALAGFSKSYFGSWSDSSGKRLPFVSGGYLLSAISKPLMALLASPVWIFLSRSLDRLGKGIRTASRDAMLSDESSPETRGRVMGFHRALDTLGAFAGPLITLGLLKFYSLSYQTLFLIAFVPGICAALLVFNVREKKIRATGVRVSLFAFSSYWKIAGKPFRLFVVAMMLFTTVNCSDFFFLLKMKNSGSESGMIILAYLFFNLVYALAAFPFGMIADKIGLKNMLGQGLLFFSAGFLFVGFADTTSGYFFAFFFHGLFYASTEGISRAMISNMVPSDQTATAIGFYTGWQSLFLLISSGLAGFVWQGTGNPSFFFLSGAVVSVSIACFFLFVFRGRAFASQ